MKQKLKTIAVWLVLVLVLFLAFHLFGRSSSPSAVDYDQLIHLVREGEVSEVWVNGNQLSFYSHDGRLAGSTFGVVTDELSDLLARHSVPLQYGEKDAGRSKVLWVLLPLLFLVVAFFIFLRKQQGSTTGIMSLTKSRARKLDGGESKVRFEDVGGAEDAKEALRDVVDFLQQPKRWRDAGVRLPRGVLLEGPPGCGKTLLARAVAGEAGVSFFFVSASEFVEMFVGVGAARVRDMFEKAAKETPCIVFIDELDAVGRRRGSGIGSAHDEREQTLNQILVSLDGFENDDQLVVIAATNRPDVLDQALLRPGRFDRRIEIPLPDEAQRAVILEIHTREKPLADEIDLSFLAAQTDGFTGADLESLCNEAALLSVRRLRTNGAEQGPRVLPEDFEAALAKLRSRERVFNSLDALLIESASQVAQPTKKAVVKVRLLDGSEYEGEVIWVDGSYVKLNVVDADRSVIIPKTQVSRIEALSGTQSTADVVPDRWAHHAPDLA